MALFDEEPSVRLKAVVVREKVVKGSKVLSSGSGSASPLKERDLLTMLVFLPSSSFSSTLPSCSFKGASSKAKLPTWIVEVRLLMVVLFLAEDGGETEALKLCPPSVGL